MPSMSNHVLYALCCDKQAVGSDYLTDVLGDLGPRCWILALVGEPTDMGRYLLPQGSVVWMIEVSLRSIAGKNLAIKAFIARLRPQ